MLHPKLKSRSFFWLYSLSLSFSLFSPSVEANISMERLEAVERAKKLYKENLYMIKENERLRKMTQILSEENQVLFDQMKLRQLQQKQQAQAAASAANPSGAQANARNGTA